MFVDIVMSIAASLLICGMILYLPVMEIDISKNMISQVLTIVVVILDDLIFTRAQKYLAIDWLALDGQTDEADAKKIEEYIRNQLQEDLEYDQMTIKEYVDQFTGEPVKKNN